MSDINTTLNNSLKNNRYTEEDYSILEFSPTSKLSNSIITYSRDLNLVFCSSCRTNLISTKVIEHLAKIHSNLYSTYKSNNIIENLEAILERIEPASIEELKNSIEPNNYLFKELDLLLNNYKCLECLYIATSSKEIRKHFRKEHKELYTSKTLKTNTKAYYILENIPIQILEGFKYNAKVLFIPKLPTKDIDLYRSRNPTREPKSRSKGKERARDTSSNSNSRVSISSRDESINSSKDNLEVLANNSKGTNVSTFNKDSILNSYRTKIEESNNSREFISNIDNNSKLLNSFVTKSNILEFLKDKDRDLLISLVSIDLDEDESNNPNIINFTKDLETVDIVKLEESIIEYFFFLNSKVNSVPLLLRQRVKGSLAGREYKDFIPLDNKFTKQTYFRVFSNLITFTLRVLYIKSSFKDSTEDRELEYYNLVKDIELDDMLYNNIVKLLSIPLDSLTTEENKLDFYSILDKIFITFIEAKNPFAIRSNSTLNNIVIGYFYIKCLSTSTKEIIPLGNIGKITSIIVYNTRLVFLGHFYLKELEEEDIGNPKEREVELLNFLDNNLSNTSKNYFEFISTLRPYILALNREVSSTNYLIREVRPNIFELDSIEYPIESISILFNNIINKLEDLLVNKLLGISSIDSLGINFKDLNDSSLYNKIGESIRDIEEVRSLKDKSPYFLEQLLEKNTYYNRTLLKGIRGNSIIFKSRAIETFNRNINNVIEYLALAIYLTSGGPLRGTELPTIIYKNIESVTRSIIYNNKDGLISITTNYSKTKNITRKEKSTLRFLSPRLSKLLIVYILYIIPFKEYILEYYYNNPNFSTPYLLVKDSTVITTNTLSRILKRESALLFRKGLTIKPYRKLINAILKMKLNNLSYNSSSNESSSNKEDLIEDRQANRSTKISYNYYFNIGTFFTKSNNLDTIAKTKEFSIKFFNFFKLLSRDDIYNNPLIAFNTKGLETLDYNRDSFRTTTLTTIDIEHNIRKLYKNSSLGFKNPEQKSGLLSIIDNTPIVTFINKTSSGKSLLYLLPSFIYSSRVFFIITPRVTLSNDLYTRAKELGLRAGTLKEELSLSNNLIFINIEDLDTTELNASIKTYKYFKKEISIYIDEVHLFLLERSFRLDLKKFTTIVKDKGFLYLLSATLPTSLLGILEDSLGIKGNNTIIRGSSNREDIIYNRILYRDNNNLYTIISSTLASIYSNDINLDNKVLIFINNIKEGKALASFLDLDFISSKDIEKDTILSTFLESSSKRALITTSILEVGLDLPKIKYTISIGPIFSLISFIQSSGRIRSSGISYIIDKEPSKYIRDNIKGDPILRDLTTITDLVQFRNLDKAYYKLLLIESNCLRLPISTFLDNIPRKCLEDSIYKCSVCSERNRVLESAKSKEELEYRANNYNLIRLEEVLIDYYSNYCLYCLIDPYNFSSNYKHSIDNCPKAKLDSLFTTTLKIIKNSIGSEVKLEANSGCSRCLIPTNICSKISREHNLEPNKCFFTDFIYNTLAIFYIYRNEIAFLLDSRLLEVEEIVFTRELVKSIENNNIKTIKIVDIIFKVEIETLIKNLEEYNKDDSSIEYRSRASSEASITSTRSRDIESNSPSNTYTRDLDSTIPSTTNIPNINKDRELVVSKGSEGIFKQFRKKTIEELDNNNPTLSTKDLDNTLLPTIASSSRSNKDIDNIGQKEVESVFKRFRKQSIEEREANKIIEPLSTTSSSKGSTSSKNRKRLKNLSIDIKDSNRVKGSSKKTRLEEGDEYYNIDDLEDKDNYNRSEDNSKRNTNNSNYRDYSDWSF